jgi:hypothetical protein
VNALRRIHAALVTGGLLIDTQPVSTRPAVATADGCRVGRLDMRDWCKLIDAVAERVDETVDEGLWADVDDRRHVVTDTFDTGAELVDTVKNWQGTQVPDALRRRISAAAGPAYVHQDVRLRVLRAL